MASYEIEISRTAEKQLKKLSVENQKRVLRSIVNLAEEPHPHGSRTLSGHDDVFRIRVGNYRILYSISGKKLIVIILKIGHRKDIYEFRGQYT